ncbi:General transcription factor IIH subunit 1 [Operophtera brumata]|uniref:General transcription factor IIH subunit 1 n=1 Tax=Operophtera brumata TaxID=104452 RepID=A0A0L7LNZ1_OPEBR|nr:General transcription factor IIH subunit 1 [Operophtera brumata]
MKHTTLDLTVDLPQFREQVPLLPNDEDAPPVLKASHKTNSNTDTDSSKKPVENGVKEKESTSNGVPVKTEGEPPEKKRRILENIHYEDLEGANEGSDTQELKLSRMNTSSTQASHPPPLSALASICQQCARPVRVGAGAAVGALGELSPGGALMRTHRAASMAQLIPADVKCELHRLYISCGELIREVWRRFPQPGATDEEITALHYFYEALLRHDADAPSKPDDRHGVRQVRHVAAEAG